MLLTSPGLSRGVMKSSPERLMASTEISRMDNPATDRVMDNQLQRLMSDIDSRTRSLEQKRGYLRDLEEGVAKCRREFESRRNRYRKLKQEYEGKAGKEHGQERLLETLFQKLNLLHHQDSEYVTTITKLRMDRKKLDTIFKQLKHDIQVQTRELIRATHVHEQAEGEKEEMLAQTKSIARRMHEQRKEFKELVDSMKEDYAKQERIQKAFTLKQNKLNSRRGGRSAGIGGLATGPGCGNQAVANDGGGNHGPSGTAAQHGGDNDHGGGGEQGANTAPSPTTTGQKQLQHLLGHQREPPAEQSSRAANPLHHNQNQHTAVISPEERKFDSSQMCRRIFRTAFFNAIQRRRIRQYNKSIEIFEQAFETIRTLTGIENLEEIVRIFTQMEDRSFSLLTYVNTLHSDIEKLEVENKAALDHLGQGPKTDLSRKRALLGVLENKIVQEENVVMEKEAEIQKGEDVIAKVREPLVRTVEVMGGMLFDMLKAPEEPPSSPSNQRLTHAPESTLMVPIDRMSVLENPIEQPVEELLNFIENNLLHFRDYLPVSAPMRILNKPHAGKGMRKPDLPTAKIDDSDTDGDELPLTRAELKLAVEKSVYARKKKPRG